MKLKLQATCWKHNFFLFYIFLATSPVITLASDSVFSNAIGDVGIGTYSPDAQLHVVSSDGSDAVHIETTATGTVTLLSHEAAERPRFELINNSIPNAIWNFDVLNNGDLSVSQDGEPEFTFHPKGDLIIKGDYFSVTCGVHTPCGPDYVFAEEYDLLPLDQLKAFISQNKHLPNVPSADEMTGPINISKLQMTLLEKIEELTLYTLQQQEVIMALEKRLRAIENPEANRKRTYGLTGK